MSHNAGRIKRAIGSALRAGFAPLTLAPAVGCIMAGAAGAQLAAGAPPPVIPAAFKPADIEGRWAYARGGCGVNACKAFYDISSCGDGWCGVEVEKDGKCGQTSIHLAVAKTQNPEPTVFSGQFRPEKGADPYVIAASMRASESGAQALLIYGHTGGEFQAFRRTFPLEIALERVAKAECHGEYESS